MSILATVGRQTQPCLLSYIQSPYGESELWKALSSSGGVDGGGVEVLGDEFGVLAIGGGSITFCSIGAAGVFARLDSPCLIMIATTFSGTPISLR